MKFVDSFKSFITKLGLSSDKEEKINLSEYQNSTFSIGVIEFSDNVENDSGKTLAKLLGQAEYFKTFYYEEPFAPNILSLESPASFNASPAAATANCVNLAIFLASFLSM